MLTGVFAYLLVDAKLMVSIIIPSFCVVDLVVDTSEGYETFQTSVRDFKSTRDF